MTRYRTIEDFPKPAVLKWAMLVVMHEFGEPMLAREIDKGVARLLDISDELFQSRLENGKKFIPYRLGWERTAAKKSGYVEKSPNSQRYWQLTEKGHLAASRNSKKVSSLI